MIHRRLLRLAGRLRGPLAVCITAGLAVLAAHIAQAVLVGMILTKVFDGVPIGESSGLFIALGVVIAGRAVLSWGRELAATTMAGTIKVRLRDELVARLIELGPGHLTRSRTGEVQATVVDGVEGLEAYYSRYLPQVVICVLGPGAIVAWMATRDLPLAVIVGAAAVALPAAPRLWDRVLRARGVDHWRAYSALSAEYLDAMQGISTLKALNAAGSRRRLLQTKGEHLFRTTMRQMAVSLVDTGLSELGVQLGTAVALAVGAFRVANGDLELGTLLVMLLLVGVAFRPFRELASAWHAGFLGVSAADGIAALLDAPAPSADRPDARTLCVGAATIELDGVTFTYPDRTIPALRQVSLRIAPGERVALVGRSGSGKSTVVNLLLRFVQPDAGALRIGGVDLAGCTAESVRRSIAVVGQDTYLFTGTVAENLRLARPEATDAELVTAATAAGAHAFIADLDGGYDAAIGERGLTLSGGQRQRIAIARALLKDAPILVLDEATSAIDAEHEDAILAALEQLSVGRTTLVIAHRLNTVRTADRIVVLEQGAVVEVGAHDALLTADGAYARLIRAQEILA